MVSIKLVLNGNIKVYDGDEKIYKSVIQGIYNDSIVINIPYGNKEYLLLEEDKEYEMYYHYDKICYSFHTKLIAKEMDSEKNISLYRIEYPYDIKKIQRRNFVRVDLIDYIKYKKIDSEDNSWDNGMLFDISGGGLRIAVDENLENEDIYLFKFKLSTNMLEVRGKIVRYIGTSTTGKVYGVEFLDISEKNRELIIREVFKQMRKERNSSI